MSNGVDSDEDIDVDSYTGPPDQITEVMINVVTPDSVDIEWEEPDANGAEITHYVITYELFDQETQGSTPKQVESQESYVVIEKLRANTAYYISVQAVNEKGTSEEGLKHYFKTS